MDGLHTPGNSQPVDKNDSLIIESHNSLSGLVLDVFARVLTLEGKIKAYQFSHTPNSDRTRAASRVRLTKGWLLSVVISPSAGTPRRGQCFVAAFVTRDDVATTGPSFPLLSDYVVQGALLAWPGSPLRSSVEGAGIIRSITGTNPAAGVEIRETVPTGARWRLKAIIFTLVTDATAVNRFGTLNIDDGVNTLHKDRFGNTITASTTNVYSFAVRGEPYSSYVLNLNNLISSILLSAGFRIFTTTTSFQAADDYSAPQLYVEEWLEP